VHGVLRTLPMAPYIISGSVDGTIRIWDDNTGAAVGKPLSGHTESVRSVVYSPDGRYITSGSSDRTIRDLGCQDWCCSWQASRGAH
jgi:WD40 repeat protein